MNRSQAGLALERLLQSIRTWDDHSLRYLFCYNGEPSDMGYDCACCLMWPDDDNYKSCGCPCHERIEKMARSGDFPLLVSALTNSDEFPKFPTSIDEHEAWRKQALEDGATHYHNTNGKFANYSKLVCSTCCPSDDRPQVKYNTKTGELLVEHFPARTESGKGPLTCGDVVVQRTDGSDPNVSPGTPHEGEWVVPPAPPGGTFIEVGDRVPDEKTKASEYVWKPGRCT